MIWKVCSRIATLIAFASLALAVTQNPASPPATQDPGQVTLNRACPVCHPLADLARTRGYYNRDQWADIVRTMRAYGAQVKDAEVTPLVEYLFKAYGKIEAPAVDGKKLLDSSCSGCHDLGLVTGRKLSKAEWQEKVDEMIGKGASVEGAQIPILVDYLFKTYGKIETPALDGEKLLESSCSGCHDLSLVTDLKLSEAEWQDKVAGMIGKGAAVEDAQIPTLVDYLFKTYGPEK